MNKDSNSTHLSSSDDAEMQPEYDFSRAIRGNPRQHLTPLNVKIETPQADRQVVIQTVEVTAIVDSDGKVTLQLPPTIAPGEHQMTLLIQEAIAP